MCWSVAQSFWREVSQQVRAGYMSAREEVAPRRETTSPISHFKSVSQRKHTRGGETERQCEGFELQQSVIWADETTAGWTERCLPCGWATVSIMCFCVASDKLFMTYFFSMSTLIFLCLAHRVSARTLKSPSVRAVTLRERITDFCLLHRLLYSFTLISSASLPGGATKR